MDKDVDSTYTSKENHYLMNTLRVVFGKIIKLQIV